MDRRSPRLRRAGSLAALVLASGCAPAPVPPEPVGVSVERSTWVQQSDVLQPWDEFHDGHFGSSVAISGDTMVVGAPYTNNGYGAAYVFERSDTAWEPVAELSPKNGVTGSHIGASVAISGDVIVVGAPGFQTSGLSLLGEVFVIGRSQGSWTLAEVIKRSMFGLSTYDLFGASVAISGKTLVVGAPREPPNGSGSVWVIPLGDDLSVDKTKVSVLFSDAAHDAFGSSVAVWGHTIVTGAPGDGTIGGPGAAYVHVWDGADWVPQATLAAGGQLGTDAFGSSVAVWQDTAVVGAPQRDTDVPGSGVVYTFSRSGGSWGPPMPLFADDRRKGDHLGSVAISGSTIVAGAPLRDLHEGPAFGAAYVFTNPGSGFARQGRLRPSSSSTILDNFGFAVAVDGTTAVVGAPLSGVSDHTTGAAAAFVLRSSNGDACKVWSDCASSVCVDGVCCETLCPGACAACSKARGASADGVCTNVSGYPGDPSCAPFLCDGTGPDCPASCRSDAGCLPGYHCAPDGACKPDVPAGGACDTAAGRDCKVAGCRVCGAGQCVAGACCTDDCPPEHGSRYSCEVGPEPRGPHLSLLLAGLAALAARLRRGGRLLRGGRNDRALPGAHARHHRGRHE